jgi:prolipoprotein diacylglyceryl transferase
VLAILASIPSPSEGSIHLGPLQLRAYGLMIALGVIAAVWLGGRRFEEKGIGTREDVSYIALWGVPAGIIGARLYHVVTDWQRFEHHPFNIVKIWEGGLGIWGGVGLGLAAGAYAGHRRGVPVLAGMDALAPAIALAQAIGRWGNWWNQELFGRPTDLPWGLEISPSQRPAGFERYSTFHPAFLYESLWNLLLCLALVWLDRKKVLRPGRIFVVYVAGYTFLRFFIERLRIDPANRILGLRVNEWVSGVLFVASTAFLVVDVLRHRGEPVPDVRRTEPPGEAADEDHSAGDAEDAAGDAEGLAPEIVEEEVEPTEAE